MAIKTFAAIYIGSYEVSLKVFEMSPKKQLRKIDYVRSRVELGKDAYTRGVIGYEMVEELCLILKEFHRMMEGYRVTEYRAYASSVLRYVSNELFILDQIRLRTGIQVKILSNSEHRFISYKSLAAEPFFEKIIQEGAAVVDVGGGSMQITLFRKGKAATTRQIDLGLMRLREKLSRIENQVSHYEDQTQELIDKELKIFKDLYLQGKKPKYAIMVGDYIGDILKETGENDTLEAERFLKAVKRLTKKSPAEIAGELSLTDEQDPLLIPSVVLYKRLAEEIEAEYVWIPGVNISDGIAIDYAQKNRLVRTEHNFDEDILSAAKALAERFFGYTRHSETVMELSATLFDAMKNVHGLTRRERLLLKAAAILKDCGNYISQVNYGECSYQIIMASEIIGMTHLEREIVASTVRYSLSALAPYEEIMDKMDQAAYLVVAKLAAILKLAYALDRSHNRKFKSAKAKLQEKQLIVTVETREPMALEKGLFQEYARAFERVFSVKPLMKEKRVFD